MTNILLVLSDYTLEYLWFVAYLPNLDKLTRTNMFVHKKERLYQCACLVHNQSEYLELT